MHGGFLVEWRNWQTLTTLSRLGYDVMKTGHQCKTLIPFYAKDVKIAKHCRFESCFHHDIVSNVKELIHSACPVVRYGKFLLSETKNTRYMKALSIVLLALTTGHAAVTGDVTALTVAFILFCYTCGKDVVSMWNKILKKQ